MATIKVVTWNVNSARARIDHITRFLESLQPDVVCLQEIKSTNDTFPFEAIRKTGYEASIFGQPAYNGVAILSRETAVDIEHGLDDEARVIAATLFGIRFINVYVPNGQRIGSSKYQYKLAWLTKLSSFLDRQYTQYGDFVIVGDFNVAPETIDLAHPEEWENKIPSDARTRELLQNMMARFHLEDILRKHDPGPGIYTWWDFRTRGFESNDGIRIDLILATAPLAARSVNAWVAVAERKRVRPSDHIPVLARLRTP